MDTVPHSQGVNVTQVYILQMVHKFCYIRWVNIFRLVLRHSPIRAEFLGKMTVYNDNFLQKSAKLALLISFVGQNRSKYHKIGPKYLRCIYKMQSSFACLTF